jgi:hypothetical protein
VSYDAVLSDTAQLFVDHLARDDRRAFNEALDVLLSDPYPDGISKVELPFPYAPGTFGFEYSDFWIAYTFMSLHMLAIAAVFWNPKSPRYPLDI